MNLKPEKPEVIEYNGIEFDNRLDAKWAMLFSHCSADWEYKPEKYRMYSFDLSGVTNNDDEFCNGYLPKFRVWNVEGCVNNELFVDVYSYMHPYQVTVVKGYAEKLISNYKSGIFVVGDIPVSEPYDIVRTTGSFETYYHYGLLTPPYYTTETTTYMGYGAGYFGVRHDGKPCLFDEETFPEMDERKTWAAYKAIKRAWFELLNEPYKEGFAHLKLSTDVERPQSQGEIFREQQQKEWKEARERRMNEIAEQKDDDETNTPVH